MPSWGPANGGSGGGGGVSDHGLLTGLGDDDHTQYGLLLGRAGGQTLIGGNAASDKLTLKSTSHATLGSIDANAELLANIGQLGVGFATVGAGVDAAIGSNATVSDGSSKVCLDLGQSRTWDTTAGGSYTGLRFQPTITATANMGNVASYIGTLNKSGTGTVTNLRAFFATLNVNAGTVTTGRGFDATVNCGIPGATLTTGIGVDVALGTGLGGTITTGIGLRILTNQATTAWGMQVGDFQSYHHGRLGLGGTTAPTYQLELQGTAADRGAMFLAESTATPTNPPSSAGVVMYHKADKLVFAFNNAGTMRYFTLDLTQTGATASWAQSTTAP